METIKYFSSVVAFYYISLHQSFTKAADELGVTKSYLSKVIKLLEKDLGHKLLNRSTRVVRLTAAGEKFFEDCYKSVENIKKATSELKSKSLSPQGVLRITMAGAFAEEYITSAASKLVKKYKNLNIELSFSESIVSLIEENFDLGIRIGRIDDSHLFSRQIASRREYICASKEYLNKFGTPKNPFELKKFNCIIGNNDYWAFKKDGQQFNVKVRGNIKSNNGRALLRSALNGVGLTRLPEIYVEKHIADGKLISILDSFMPEEVPIWIIYPRSKHLSINSKVFLKELEQEFDLPSLE